MLLTVENWVFLALGFAFGVGLTAHWIYEAGKREGMRYALDGD